MLAAFAAATTVGYATPAAAQATRTWVSGTGDDVNPCSRTAPCKTFAGAISKTAAGGEINCLDPGGYGAVTITKSITIDCHYTEGGALAGGNGIVVNDGGTATPNTAVVVIRGLDIFGVNPPLNGVRFIAGASLTIEDSIIRRFNAANSFGVSFQPAAAAKLYMNNVLVSSNGSGATGGGILVQPTGAAGNAKVTLVDVRSNDNGGMGLKVDSTGNSNASGVTVLVHKSQFNGNAGEGMRAIMGAGTNPVRVMVTESTFSFNGLSGIAGDGFGVQMRVGNTTVTGNATGVDAFNASIISSYGDNRVIANPATGANNGGFNGIIPKE
jgi:hypothetical protein